MDNIRPDEWIRPFQPTIRPKAEPQVDERVSQIVGKKVFTNDRRLMNLVIKFKNQKDPDQPDNFLQSERFRDELKKTFNEN